MPTSTRGRDPAVEEEFLGALYKGGELLASGKIVEAREHLEKAHGLEPKNEKAQNLLGLTYFKLGLFDRASAVYEGLVNENPTDATLRVNLGLVYLKTNNLERCIKEFETATDLEPTHKKAHNYLGLALAQQGTYGKAKTHFELAGSDQMADKMARALAAQVTPSGSHEAVPRQQPKTVVIGEEAEVAPPPKGPPPLPVKAHVEEEAIEVMSDEELPSDVYVVADEVQVAPAPSSPGLNSDWGTQLRARPSAPVEMRFAEDEGPPAIAAEVPATIEELPVLEAVVEVMPPDSVPEAPAATPAWLTMEAAEATRAGTRTETAWVTESVADVPLHAEAEPAQPPSATDARWDAPAEAHPAPLAAEDASWESVAPANDATPAEEPETIPMDDAAWAISGAAPVTEVAPLEAAPPQNDGAWANAEITEAPAPESASWATAEGSAANEPQPEMQPLAADEATWAAQAGAAEAALPMMAEDAAWGAEVAPTEAVATTPEDSTWATGAPEASLADAMPAATETWATAGTEAMQPAPDDATWATGGPQEPVPGALPPTPDDAAWATGPMEAPVAEALPTTPDDAAWATGPMEAPAPEALQATAEDAAWATAETQAPAPEALSATPDDAAWATAETQAPAPEALQAAPEDAAWATATLETTPPDAQPTVPDEASWAAAAEAPVPEALPTSPDDATWATGTVEATPSPEWATDQVEGVNPTPIPAPAPQPEWQEAHWATPATPVEPEVAAAPVDFIAPPEPSAPLSITVEEPITAPAPSAPLSITVEEPMEAPAPMAPPAGYTPMSPQKLVDLGASGSWVQDSSAGPFHISSDGLAVTVAGEMLVRMVGLVAVVGSVTVSPENRRRRGRPTSEPFGEGQAQLQRVQGHGVLYLEPGRAKFHAIDLTDQNGVKIDDDGAYLREDLVFAFEEPISFDNGKLTAEGQSFELAHLKGNGRVLLQLDGTLRAMPIPLGAPLVVPLHRVVGWFGRVSPRLMGFGGRGAVELTGEGYALLGTPVEKA